MLTAQEKHLNYNSLIGILKACVGKKVQIDLRNESHIYGRVDDVYSQMNVALSDAVLLAASNDPNAKSNAKKFKSITIRGKNIRFVHIPDEVDMISALEHQILSMSRPNLKKSKFEFKNKRPMPKANS